MVDDWRGLLAYFKAHHAPVHPVGGTHVRCTVHVGMSHVELLATESVGPNLHSWIVLAARICRLGELRGRSALVAATDLPLGAFATIGKFAALVHSVPMTGLTEELLSRTLGTLAATTSDLLAARGLVSDAEAAQEPNLHPFAYIYVQEPMT